MAKKTARVTYSVDLETVEMLEELAYRWGVSKSEALGRAIRLAELNQSRYGPLQAFKELQASMKLSKTEASKWCRKIRRERSNSSTRRLSRYSS